MYYGHLHYAIWLWIWMRLFKSDQVWKSLMGVARGLKFLLCSWVPNMVLKSPIMHQGMGWLVRSWVRVSHRVLLLMWHVEAYMAATTNVLLFWTIWKETSWSSIWMITGFRFMEQKHQRLGERLPLLLTLSSHLQWKLNSQSYRWINSLKTESTLSYTLYLFLSQDIYIMHGESKSFL